MTPERDLARRLADHFADEAPRLAPDWVLPSALITIESTRQRRGLLAPWRFHPMPMYARLGAAAAAVVVVAVVAIWQLAPPSGPGHPTSSPSPSQSPVAVQPGTGYVPPPLSQSFTSGIYGLSLSYPQGWTAMPATTPWAVDPGIYREPLGDLLYDPTRENLFLKLASQPLGSTTFEQWSATVFAGRECAGARTPVVVDGAQGLLDPSCYAAVIPSGGRGYLIVAHWNADISELRPIDWAAWLQQVLGTVQLQPEQAVDGK